MRIYLKIIGVFYFVGFILHVMDLFGARLNFTEMKMVWKIWIIYLTLADATASYGLIRNRIFGEILFLVVAFSQLVAYTIFAHIFGPQTLLIIFHLLTVGIYIFLLRAKNLMSSKESRELTSESSNNLKAEES